MTAPDSDAERLAAIDEKLRREDANEGGWMLSHSDGRFLRLLVVERGVEIERLNAEIARLRGQLHDARKEVFRQLEERRALGDPRLCVGVPTDARPIAPTGSPKP